MVQPVRDLAPDFGGIAALQHFPGSKFHLFACPKNRGQFSLPALAQQGFVITRTPQKVFHRMVKHDI